jgi:hypothetical protein
MEGVEFVPRQKKPSGRNHISSMLILYIVLTSAFAIVLVAPGVAHASCNGSGVKYNATAADTDSITDRGNFGYDFPVSSAYCGSSWSEGSYMSLYNTVWTTSDFANYLEAGWYYGYNDFGSSSPNGPAFYYILVNFWSGTHKSDVSLGTGIYPHWNDQINVTNRYDHTDGLVRDYYKLIYYDTTSGSTITITNLWVDGRGYQNYFQSETFNSVNYLQGKFTTGKYYASSTWTPWGSSSLMNDMGGKELCVSSTSVNSFKFGTDSSGTCFLP